MIEKRGQVTIFIIVAILIVGVVVGVFMLKPKVESGVSPDVKPIYDFAENCIKETSENALIRIGEQGGYFLIFDEPSIEGRIPYYLRETEKSILTEEEIELNIAGFIREELGFCVLNFKDFREEFEIEHELKNIDVKIQENSVNLKTEYLISVTQKESGNSYQLKDFSINLPIRLDEIYRVSEKIIDEQVQHPESICLSCLYDLGEDYNVHIDMLDYGNSTIFTIIDDNSKINNQSYEWNFAIK